MGEVCIWWTGGGAELYGYGLGLGVCVRRGVEQGIWTCRPMLAWKRHEPGGVTVL